MSWIGRLVAFAFLLLAAVPASWSAAAAQESSGEYREALNGLHSEMNELTLEIENFRINSRYCKPPGIPSKAEAQAELDALAARAQALTQRYNALKQSLKDFARNPRVAAELMLRDIDPTDDRWFSSYEAARRRMSDALARKRAALAAAPEVDCTPRPKPQPPVTTGGFQPPALPVRPTVNPTGWPPLPTHFCSWDERIKFFEMFDPIYLKASDDAVRAAEFRTEVERAVNSYVQNDRPVPPELAARRRQAIADVEAAAGRVREAEEMRRRALAIPVIDCRTPRQEPPRTEPPRQETQTGQATPQQGLDATDQFAIARQQGEIEAIEKALADLREFQRQGDCGKAWELAEELDEWLDDLAPTPAGAIRVGVIIPKPNLPPGQLEKWSQELDEIMEDCPPPGSRLEISTILNLHNAERTRFGYQPLRWSFRLSDNAQEYANQLASTGRRVHASREGRGIERENLSQGMLGWNTRQMMTSWLDEKPFFRPGIFPNVSTTGDWYKVGHYSQMIWPTTIKIGCGLASGSGYSWLVCRYSPGGNKDGKSVGLPQTPSPRHVVADTPPMPQPRGEVANQDGVAPPNSGTTTVRPNLPRLPVGGGMQQLDPPAPPPPPPPTARDDAPQGNEEKHPVVEYGLSAFIRYTAATNCGDRAAADAELEKMRYALEELRKRLKAARRAGPYSAVKPADVQKQIDNLERLLRSAEEQRQPRGTCPPQPQQRGVINQRNPL